MTMPAAPQPAVPLNYREPMSQRGRPGLLTAVAVISIIIGGLGGLGSLSGVLSSIMYLNMSSMRLPVPTAPGAGAGTAMSPQALPGGGIFVNGELMDPTESDEGLSEDARRVTLGAIQRATPLNAAQSHNADALLAYCGLRVFPFLSDQVGDAQKVQRNISGTSRRGNVAVVTVGTGRLEIGDDRAAFLPVDGGQKVEAVGKPNQVEAAAIATAARQRTRITGSFRSSTSVVVGGGKVVTSSTTYSTTAPVLASGAAAMTIPVSRAGAGLSLAEEILSGLLAVLLFIAALKLLRDRPGALRWHRIWALAKIPVVMIGAVATYLTMSVMMSGMTASMTSAGALPAPVATWFNIAAVASAVMKLLFGLIYPIALLIVLRTRRVRDYWASVEGGAVA